MAAEDDGKTEDPTGRKLDEARSQGQVPQSHELRLLASLLAAMVVLTVLSKRTALGVRDALVPLLDHPHEFEVSADSLNTLVVHLAWAVGSVVIWPVVVVMVITVGAMVAQTRGFLWTPSKLFPDFSRINPATHLARLFSTQNLVDMLKNLAKLTILGTVMVLLLRPRANEFQNLGELTLPAMMSYVADRIFTLIFAALLMQLVLTAADFGFQYWRFLEQMKMTRQEVRDEHKQQEGDPLVKGKLRNLRMKRARQRMMQQVPSADVIVTNPTHYAVALKYDSATMTAPVLLAKGLDLVAMRIREVADEHEIPIVENPPLARALYATVELDQEIPPEHYKAVAEIIGYVMRLKGKFTARRPN